MLFLITIPLCFYIGRNMTEEDPAPYIVIILVATLFVTLFSNFD